MSAVPVFIGIDVSQGHLDVAVRPTGEQCRMVHSDSGITAVVERVQQSQPQLVVLEATGGLEMCLASALAAAGLPVVSSIHGRCATLPKPWAGWPRPIGWMPGFWPSLPSGYGRRPALCQRRARRNWPHC